MFLLQGRAAAREWAAPAQSRGLAAAVSALPQQQPSPAAAGAAGGATLQQHGGHHRGKRISELAGEEASARPAPQQPGAAAAPPAGLVEGEALSRHCTWEIGGPARYLLEVHTAREMADALSWARGRGLRPLVLGKGSNVLFDDRGFDGAVLVNRIEFLEDLGGGAFRVGAGVAFNALGVHVSRAGWTGLEASREAGVEP